MNRRNALVLVDPQTGLMSLARRWLALGLALAQLILLLSFGLYGFVGRAGIGPDFDFANPVIPPAGALFIWVPIALGCMGHGLVVLHPRYRDDTLFRRIGWLFVIGLGLSCTRLVFAQTGPAALTAPLALAMLLVFGWGMMAIARWPRPISLARSMVVTAPFGLLTGWMTAESIFNMAALLPTYGFGGGVFSAIGIAYTALLGIFAIGVAGLRATRGDLYHGAGLLWALFAIMGRNGWPWSGNGLAVTALLAMLVIGAYMAWLRTRPRSHRF